MGITLFNNKPIKSINIDSDFPGIIRFQIGERPTQSYNFNVAALAAGYVGGAAGNNTEIQYNNAGAIGASSNLSWDNSNLNLRAGTVTNTNTGTQTGNFIQGTNHTIAGAGLFRFNMITGIGHTLTADITGPIRWLQIAGESHTITSSGGSNTNCLIWGGYNNSIVNNATASNCGLFAGSSNNMNVSAGLPTYGAVILGGRNCDLTGDFDGAALVGGRNNNLTGYCEYSAIIGGRNITATDLANTVFMPSIRIGLGTGGALTAATGGETPLVHDSVTGEVRTADGGAIAQLVEITLSSAQILALNSSPQTLVAAQGAGTFIQILSPITLVTDFGTVAYDTNTTPVVQYDSGDVLATFTTALASTADEVSQTTITAVARQTDVLDSAIEIIELVGDPATGDGEVVISFQYRVITLP